MESGQDGKTNQPLAEGRRAHHHKRGCRLKPSHTRRRSAVFTGSAIFVGQIVFLFFANPTLCFPVFTLFTTAQLVKPDLEVASARLREAQKVMNDDAVGIFAHPIFFAPSGQVGAPSFYSNHQKPFSAAAKWQLKSKTRSTAKSFRLKTSLRRTTAPASTAAMRSLLTLVSAAHLCMSSLPLSSSSPVAFTYSDWLSLVRFFL